MATWLRRVRTLWLTSAMVLWIEPLTAWVILVGAG